MFSLLEYKFEVIRVLIIYVKIHKVSQQLVNMVDIIMKVPVTLYFSSNFWDMLFKNKY